MDTTETYALGVQHGDKIGKTLNLVTATVKPVARLAFLGFGVMLLVGMVYPEITKNTPSS